MKDFPLIKQLNNPSEKETTLPEGIKYQEYEVNIQNETCTVAIPLREATKFENALVDIDANTIDKETLKKLLRQFRGVRG